METAHIKQLTKVSHKSFVELGYIFGDENEGEVKSHPFPKTAVPQPQFIDAMQALAPHACSILGIQLKGQAKYEVQEVALTNCSGDEYDFQIKGFLHPPKGPGGCSMNTPFRSTKTGPMHVVNAKTPQAIDKLLIAATNFMRGDRAQVALFEEGANENGQSEEKKELVEA